MKYALRRFLKETSFEEAVAKTRSALQAEGFGIPVEMDTRALFKAKLGEESESRVILGACLPKVAFEALKQEPDIAVLLPCNVVVRQLEGGCEVSTISPKVLFAMTSEVDPKYADLVEGKLLGVLERVGS